jgi:orotate phosphoribosyltransferase
VWWQAVTRSGKRQFNEEEQVHSPQLNRLADQLFEVGAVKLAGQPGEFELNLRTPDNDGGPLTPVIVRRVAWEMFHSISFATGRNFNYLAGIPKAGEPLALELHTEYELAIPGALKLLHFGNKEADGVRHIAGMLEELHPEPGCNRLLLVDDLVNTKLEEIAAAEAAGFEVIGVIVIVDHQQDGSEQLAEKGYKLRSLFQLTELLDYYVETGKISREKALEAGIHLRANHV